VFLIWAVLFPVVWLVLLVNARDEDGESLRLLDISFFGMTGGAIWIAGLVIVFLISEVDRWFVDRRRR
jgi:hypothetical protein